MIDRETVLQFINRLWNTFNWLDGWAESSNLLLPVILSLVAAFVFWSVFSYLPERTRRNKLRPVVELVLFDAYKNLFSLFDLILRHNDHSPSFYQPEVRSGKLSEETISLGLRNKCLNDSYRYDPKVEAAFLTIGREILDKSLELDELANKVLSFHTYATSQEILLLEEIREKIRVYHFGERHISRDSETIIGGVSHRPVDPSISYRKSNFYDIYQLFCKLQTIVLNRKPLDRERFNYKMKELYYSGQFRLCRKLILSEGKRFEKDFTLCNNYLALCELKIGNNKKFYKIIENTYKDRPYNGSLVSSRSTFKHLLGDSNLLEILSQFYSDEEISALRKSVQDDQISKEVFERSNEALEKYFKNKALSIKSRKNTN